MADHLTQVAKTAGLLSGRGGIPARNRTYKDGSLQHQFFSAETTAYTQEMGKYASNVFSAQIQGLNPDDFFEWQTVKLRSIRAAQAQTGETMPSDWQRIYIVSPANYTYVPQGAMVKYADNTWIVYKDKNIAAIFGNSVVRRCNAVINVLDWYGNIVSVPMSYAKMGTLGNATHATENTITSKNYIACICQLNEYSKAFTENTRIVLGKTAYQMRGLDDFTREFTDDPDSVHLLTFTIERTELQAYDSAEYGVADYYGFHWDIDVAYGSSMIQGTTQQLQATSRRNGETVANIQEHPISYIYASSDENVLTVDEDGTVTAVGEGSATITVTLEQNPDKTTEIDIDVPAAEEAFIAWTVTMPATLRAFSTIQVAAAYFENGVKTENPVSFTFSGPEKGAFSTKPGFEPNSYNVTAFYASPIPLTVTATSGDHELTAEITLTN